MIYSVSQLVERVKLDMEELTPEWDFDYDRKNGVEISRYIRPKLVDALRRIWLSAPSAWLPVKEIAGSLEAIRRSDGSGRVLLPDGILRIVEFAMEGWKRPVVKFIGTEHPMYELQFNRYSRGGASKPVCVLSTDGSGHPILDYFSLPASVRTHRIACAKVVEEPDENADSYEIHPALTDRVVSLCASMVYDILGNTAMAAVMQKRCAD